MATPQIALNSDKVWKRIVSLMMTSAATDVSHVSSSQRRGTNISDKKKRVWVCAGTPNAARTSMQGGDLVLDTTNGLVYKYISSTTYVSMNATS